MPYIPKEVVAKVKEIDLLTYLKHYEPSELVELGNNVYSTKTHDSLKISNGRWMWWSRGIGGWSALDYLIKVKGYSFLEAVETIAGDEGVFPVAFAKKKGKPKENNSSFNNPSNWSATEQKPKELNLPDRNHNENRIIKYLKERGIDASIITDCIKNGLVYESKKYHSVIFVGSDTKGTPRFACYRATNYGRAMGDLWGSDKRYSFQSRYKNGSSLHVFEGAIDLLSFATMLKMRGYSWKKTNLLSLSGVYVPEKNREYRLPVALDMFLKNNSQIEKVYLKLDKDKPGMFAAQAIQKVLEDKYKVVVIPPPQGKDYNDYLQILRKNQNAYWDTFSSPVKGMSPETFTKLESQKGVMKIMEEKKLTVLVVKPNVSPKVIEIDDTLKAMQEVVGGYIQEIVPFKDDVAIICNEEGKLQNLPPNRAIYDREGKVADVIVGDFFICRAPVESDTFESLTGDDITKYSEKFKYPERFSRSGNAIIVSKIVPNKEDHER